MVAWAARNEWIDGKERGELNERQKERGNQSLQTNAQAACSVCSTRTTFYAAPASTQVHSLQSSATLLVDHSTRVIVHFLFVSSSSEMRDNLASSLQSATRALFLPSLSQPHWQSHHNISSVASVSYSATNSPDTVDLGILTREYFHL